MDFTIDVANSGKFIIVKMTGSFDSTIANKCSLQVREVSAERQIESFLFDVREATNVSSALDKYMFARSDMRRHNLSRTARSAILARPGDQSHDLVEAFVQQVGYNVRLFRDLAAATAWLEESAPS